MPPCLSHLVIRDNCNVDYELVFFEAELIFEPIIDRNPGDESNPQLEIILRFFSSGFTGVAAWWLEKGKPLSIEKASLQIARDILPDYLRLMGTET